MNLKPGDKVIVTRTRLTGDSGATWAGHSGEVTKVYRHINRFVVREGLNTYFLDPSDPELSIWRQG